jgi:ribosomal RNA-processing protein 36
MNASIAERLAALRDGSARDTVRRGTKRPRDADAIAGAGVPSDGAAAAARAGADGREPAPAARRNKHAPAEVSSHRRVPLGVRSVAVPRVERRDPRFEDAAGAYVEDHWRTSFRFIDGVVAEDASALRGEIGAARTRLNRFRAKAGAAAPLPPALAAAERGAEHAARRLQSLQQARAELGRRDREATAKAAWRARERDLVAAGAAPRFASQRELREAALVEQFAALSKQGDAALERAMAKRARRVAARSHKWRPGAGAAARDGGDGGDA